MNRLSVLYLDNGAKVYVKILEREIGIFSLSEKFIQQLYEFYEQGVISFREVQYHLSIFFEEQSMHTRLIGGLAPYQQIHNLFGGKIKMRAFKKMKNVSLCFWKGVGLFTFSAEENHKNVCLSNYLLCNEDAYRFIDFLALYNFIEEHESDFLLSQVDYYFKNFHFSRTEMSN